ncbi:MAG: methyl-accepting chemotaxis protein [Actinomycetota bacterium]
MIRDFTRTIGGRLSVAFAVVILVVLASTGIIWNAQTSVETSFDFYRLNNAGEKAAADVVSTQRLRRTIAAEYLLEPDAALVERFEEQRSSAASTLDQLREDFGHRPDIVDAIEVANDAGGVYSRIFLDQAVPLAEGGDLEGARALLPEMVDAQVVARDTTFVVRDLIAELSAQRSDEVRDGVSSSIITVLLGGLVTAAVAVGAALVVRRSIVKPVSRLNAAADRLAEGDNDVDLDVTDHDDELSRLERAFDGIRSSSAASAGVAERIASGDLTVEVPVRSERDQLGKALEAMVGQLRGLVERASGSATEVVDRAASLAEVSAESKATTDQLATSVQAVAEGALHQAESTEDVAASGSEISTQADDMSARATEAGEAVDAARDRGREGQVAVDRVSDVMDSVLDQTTQTTELIAGLEEKANGVSATVEVIRGIAEQTNLLALNAAIEAARAGEQGRGFAVVAAEVKALAEEAARSTQEIDGIVTEVVDAVGTANTRARANLESVAEGKGLMSDVLAAFDGIAQSIEQLAATTAATQETARTLQERAASIGGQTQSLAALAEENGASSEEASAAAEEMAASTAEIDSSAQSLKAAGSELQDSLSAFRL